jgi:hypothetical protein
MGGQRWIERNGSYADPLDASDAPDARAGVQHGCEGQSRPTCLLILPASIAIASAIMTSDCEMQQRKLRGAGSAVIRRTIDRAGRGKHACCGALRYAIRPSFAV